MVFECSLMACCRFASNNGAVKLPHDLSYCDSLVFMYVQLGDTCTVD